MSDREKRLKGLQSLQFVEMRNKNPGIGYDLGFKKNLD